MSVDWLFIAAVVVVLFLMIRGWRRGFLRLIYDLAAVFIAIALAGYALPYADSPIAFFAAFCVIVIILIVIGKMLLKVNRIPVIGKINRFVGLIAGAFLGVIIIWVCSLVISQIGTLL